MSKFHTTSLGMVFKTSRSSLSIYIFFLLVFFFSCSHKPEKRNQQTPFSYRQLSDEDKKWMEPFFKEFFLESPAIYTLFGTKPMSQITLISADEKEWIDSAKPYLQIEKAKKNKKSLTKSENTTKITICFKIGKSGWS